MITKQEHARIKQIKANIAAATSEDKQWVLDLIAREHEPIRRVVKVRAKNEGFNVAGIRVL